MKKFPTIVLPVIAAVTLFITYSFAATQKEVPYPSDFYYKGTGEAVLFSHRAHVSDFGLGCDACHTKVFELTKFAARDKGDFTMAAMNAGRYCGACHNGETAFAANDFARCDSCHAGTGGKDVASTEQETVVGPSGVITLGKDENIAGFRHESHAPFKCAECHTALFPMKNTGTITNMDEINAGKSCGTCHNGEKAFDPSNCGSCHPKM